MEIQSEIINPESIMAHSSLYYHNYNNRLNFVLLFIRMKGIEGYVLVVVCVMCLRVCSCPSPNDGVFQVTSSKFLSVNLP